MVPDLFAGLSLKNHQQSCSAIEGYGHQLKRTFRKVQQLCEVNYITSKYPCMLWLDVSR